jgi:hypothetical protein
MNKFIINLVFIVIVTLLFSISQEWWIGHISWALGLIVLFMAYLLWQLQVEQRRVKVLSLFVSEMIRGEELKQSGYAKALISMMHDHLSNNMPYTDYKKLARPRWKNLFFYEDLGFYYLDTLYQDLHTEMNKEITGIKQGQNSKKEQ